MTNCHSWYVSTLKKLIFSTDSIHFSHFIFLQVDERAVLKHFDWPELKADAMREAAFGYCDLKKLEYEASSFCDDIRRPCGPALKKMQALLEKYNTLYISFWIPNFGNFNVGTCELGNSEIFQKISQWVWIIVLPS